MICDRAAQLIRADSLLAPEEGESSVNRPDLLSSCRGR